MTANQENYNRYKKYSTDLRRYYQLPSVQVSMSVVLSIFVSAFFIIAAIRPTLVTIAQLNKTITESEKTLTDLENKAQALAQISATWDRIKPLTKYLNNNIPDDGPRYQDLTKSMEVLAYENGLIITNMYVGDALINSKVANPYTGKNRTVLTVPFLIHVNGSYPQTSEFLNQITNIDRLVNIDIISFTKESKYSEDKEAISFQVTGNVTYLADENVLNSILKKKENR